MTKQGAIAAVFQLLANPNDSSRLHEWTANELRVRIDIPLVILADGREVRLTPADIMDALQEQSR